MTGSNKATLTDEQRERISKAVMSGGWAAGFHALVEEAIDPTSPKHADKFEALLAASGVDECYLIDTIRQYLTVTAFYNTFQLSGRLNRFYESAKALNDHYHLLDSEVTQLLQSYKSEIIEPLQTISFSRIESTHDTPDLYHLIKFALVALVNAPDEVGVTFKQDNFMSLRMKDGKIKLFYVLEESGK